MTGVQTSSASSNPIVALVELPSELSDTWSDMDVIRAFSRAIPADKRQEALAALMALACCQKNDAKKVS
jgi:hypothetical protein